MKIVRKVTYTGSALLLALCALNGIQGAAGTRVLAAPATRPSAATKHVVAKTVGGAFAFSPKKLKIKAGTKVVWKNNTPAPHTVTGTGSWKFNSATFNQGGSVSHVFKKAGTYHYKCAIHPYMTATIVVTK